MAEISEMELEALWGEFHSVVNMTSQELGAWLRASSAGEHTEELPEEAGDERGRRVLALLRKRRTDLVPEDVELMREVVDTVNAERARVRPEEALQDDAWRRRMMSLGHDPVKASSA